MPPQDDSAPPELRMEDVLAEKKLNGGKSQFLYDFLNTSSHSNVSDGTEETQVSSSTSSSALYTSSMTVVGIYTRGEIPREKELPEDYGLSHVKKDQVMVRRKMNTPPKHLEEENQDDIEEAMFVPEQGLVGPMFFHTDVDEHDESDDEDEEEEEEDDDWEPRIYEERAILFQAVDHYEQLLEEPKLSKYFKEENKQDSDAKTSDEKGEVSPSDMEIPSKNLQSILENPRFGEQIIVQGIDASQIAIGDIFEIEGGLSPLKVEITCPRLCCAWVDKRNGSPFGLAGVKRFCNKSGLGGFFARVLVAGDLRDEMKFVRTAHPHPKWTLAYISEALYGEGPKTYLMAGWAHWQRSKEELKELCKVEQLGEYEWKEEAEYILKKWKEYRPEDKKPAKATTVVDRIRNKMRLETIFETEVVDCKFVPSLSEGLIIQLLVVLIACFLAMSMFSATYKTPTLA